MIFRKQTVAGLLLALVVVATKLPAYAGIGPPHIGKKKKEDRIFFPTRKLTARPERAHRQGNPARKRSN